jgi:hypothetical protein
MRWLLMTMTITIMACTPAPPCGNGVVDEGETNATCCEDVGCEVGVCGASQRCELPWEATCATAGCIEDGPLQCSDDATVPPKADCAACGCPNDGACLQGVCVDADVREEARDDDLVSDLLDDEDYVALLRLITRAPAIPLAEARRRLDARRLADPRRIVRVIGVDRIDGEGGGGELLDGSSIDPADAICSSWLNQNGLYPERRQQLSVPVDQVDDVTCRYPGQFSRCQLPLIGGCVAASGRSAERLLVVGTAAYQDVDDALLRHAVRSSRNQWLVRFDDVASLYSDAVSVLADDRFDDAGRQVRVVVDDSDGVWWIHAPPIDARPHQTLSFRALWADAQTRAFIEDEDMLPTDCRFEVGAGIMVECQRAGARLTATMSLDHVLIDTTLEGA